MSSGNHYDSFKEHVKDMSHTARASLNAIGVPLDIRDKIMSQTAYSNSGKRSIEFFKDKMGEKTFGTFIWSLSNPQYIELGEDNVQPLTAYPSWLVEITEQFIDLLKLTQNLPPVLIPFQQIIYNYFPEIIEPSRSDFSEQVYIQKCNEIIERFIIEQKLNPESELAKKIKHFLNNVVVILIEYLKQNKPQIERYSTINRRIPGRQKSMDVRLGINSRFIVAIFPIFETLFELNKNSENHRLIKDINLREWVEYGKAQKEFIKSKLKSKLTQEDPERYQDYEDGDWDWVLTQYAEEIDEERRQAQRAAAQGGRKNNKRSLRSRNSYKKRTHKKRAYKKRSYKNKKM